MMTELTEATAGTASGSGTQPDQAATYDWTDQIDNSNNPAPAPETGNAQGPAPPSLLRAGKRKTPDFSAFFKSLSLKTKLSWNKEREERNDNRDAARIRAAEAEIPNYTSENESLGSIASGDLKPLCDQIIYESFSDALSDSVKLRIAKLKRKRPLTEPTGTAPTSDGPPPSNRRKMNGDLLKLRDAREAHVRIPDIFYTTEDEGAHLPLPLFHPEAIRYVVTNLATIPLTRINPRHGEPKGRSILDIRKLCKIFGDELDPNFSYDKYLESATNYLTFQTSCDAMMDPNSGLGCGTWSSTWFSHFGFFTRKKDTGALFPFWRQYELELRQSILLENSPYIESRYDQIFYLARSNAAVEASTKLLISEMSPTRPPGATPSAKRFFRQDKESPKSGRKNSKDSNSHGGLCLACTKEHTVFQHIANGLPNSFPDGKPTHCCVSDGKLLLPSGSKPCFIFNLASFTTRSCAAKCPCSHLCSFCGGHHPAFSWACRRAPNKQD
jgi:hypothetical protein